MKAGELRELSPGELAAKARELRNERVTARIRHSTGQLESTARLRELRRDIARVLTVLREGGASR